MTRNNQLREILEKASELCDPRREFLLQWLKDHFGFSETERIELHLTTLKEDIVSREVNLVAQEYQWCKDVSLEKICKLNP